MSATCPFCEIVAGRDAAAVVFEDDQIMVFVDLCPIRLGHLQIIPKAHYPYFDDLPPDVASRILHAGQRFARSLKTLYHVQRVGFVFTGNDVAHAHAHLVPLHKPTDITSRRYIANQDVAFVGRPHISLQDRQAIADEIKSVSFPATH